MTIIDQLLAIPPRGYPYFTVVILPAADYDTIQQEVAPIIDDYLMGPDGYERYTRQHAGKTWAYWAHRAEGKIINILCLTVFCGGQEFRVFGPGMPLPEWAKPRS